MEQEFKVVKYSKIDEIQENDELKSIMLEMSMTETRIDQDSITHNDMKYNEVGDAENKIANLSDQQMELLASYGLDFYNVTNANYYNIDDVEEAAAAVSEKYGSYSRQLLKYTKDKICIEFWIKLNKNYIKVKDFQNMKFYKANIRYDVEKSEYIKAIIGSIGNKNINEIFIKTTKRHSKHDELYEATKLGAENNLVIQVNRYEIEQGTTLQVTDEIEETNIRILTFREYDRTKTYIVNIKTNKIEKIKSIMNYKSLIKIITKPKRVSGILTVLFANIIINIWILIAILLFNYSTMLIWVMLIGGHVIIPIMFILNLGAIVKQQTSLKTIKLWNLMKS